MLDFSFTSSLPQLYFSFTSSLLQLHFSFTSALLGPIVYFTSAIGTHVAALMTGLVSSVTCFSEWVLSWPQPIERFSEFRDLL